MTDLRDLRRCIPITRPRLHGWRVSGLFVALLFGMNACRCPPPPAPRVEVGWARPLSQDVRSGFHQVASDVELIRQLPEACGLDRQKAFGEGIVPRIEELQEIDAGHAFLRDRGAWARLQAGDPERALMEYQDVITVTGGADSVWVPGWVGVARVQASLGRWEDSRDSLAAARQALEALSTAPWTGDDDQGGRVARIWLWTVVAVEWDECGVSPSMLPSLEQDRESPLAMQKHQTIEDRIRAWLDLHEYELVEAEVSGAAGRSGALRAILERHPDHRPTRLRLAEVYLEMGRSREARVLLDAMSDAPNVTTHGRFEVLRIQATVESASKLVKSSPKEARALLAKARELLNDYVARFPGWRDIRSPFDPTQSQTRMLEAMIFAVEGRCRVASSSAGTATDARSPQLDLIAAWAVLAPVIEHAEAYSEAGAPCVDAELLNRANEEIDRLRAILEPAESAA
jgi:hypothetical protein